MGFFNGSYRVNQCGFVWRESRWTPSRIHRGLRCVMDLLRDASRGMASLNTGLGMRLVRGLAGAAGGRGQGKDSLGGW